jgi:hypothetical protein
LLGYTLEIIGEGKGIRQDRERFYNLPFCCSTLGQVGKMGALELLKAEILEGQRDYRVQRKGRAKSELEFLQV